MCYVVRSDHRLFTFLSEAGYMFGTILLAMLVGAVIGGLMAYHMKPSGLVKAEKYSYSRERGAYIPVSMAEADAKDARQATADAHTVFVDPIQTMGEAVGLG